MTRGMESLQTKASKLYESDSLSATLEASSTSSGITAAVTVSSPLFPISTPNIHTPMNCQGEVCERCMIKSPLPNTAASVHG